ncbi:hypothetical protein FVE85_9194 [Porphyridium purpureum]|uniref:BAR domain-containing protein n=1 Tax=Porphyridium purpureum TaxID=35688 RepID=A0A5J4YPW5_PORPP|nr:hypothetical protein FVE85_9194 [Porphyridium purpureum]|eukprot:POR0827..scf222_8
MATDIAGCAKARCEMTSMFSGLGESLKGASSRFEAELNSAGKKLNEALAGSNTPKPGVWPDELFAHDEPLRVPIRELESAEQLLQRAETTIKHHAQMLNKSAASHRALGEALASTSGVCQPVMEKFIDSDRILAQLSLAASHMSEAHAKTAFADQISAPIEMLRNEFESKRLQTLLPLRRVYAEKKKLYGAKLVAIGDSSDPVRSLAIKDEASVVEAEWRDISTQIAATAEALVTAIHSGLGEYFKHYAALCSDLAENLGTALALRGDNQEDSS